MKSPVILRVFKNNQLIEVKQFDQNQIVMGQESDAHLVLKGEGIGGIHCCIEKRETGFHICDLGSPTGTFKNGQAVLDAPLASGDQIGVGPYKIAFFFGVPKTINDKPTTAVPSGVTPKIPTPSAPLKPPPPPAQAAVPTAKVDAAKPETVKAPAKATRPSLRTQNSKSSSKKGKKTFPPPSEIKDLKTHLRPGKGPMVEVIVAWKERILTTYHFRSQGIVRAGPGEDFQISLPDKAVPRAWPLLEIGGGVRVAVGYDMGFELVSSQGRKNLDEVIKLGKGVKSSNGTFVRLDQNEMICLSMMGGVIQVYIRYAPQVAVAPLIPGLLLSGPELTAVVMSLVLVGLLAFYISATTPVEIPDKVDEEITRTAQIIFNPTAPQPPPPKEVPPPPPPEVKPPKETEAEKAKVADRKQEAQKKGQVTPDAKAVKAAQAGRAAEVAPIPNSKNRVKKFTSTKQGGAIKLGPTPGANAQSAPKDLSRVGIFSAFGPGGSRKQLDTSYSGAGGILGQADKATGSSGMDANRPGDDLGSKFKDTGAGGKGTATEGISGIGTKGRSTGQGLYGTIDGFGNKTSVAIEPGDSEVAFAGTIDKEAVRRRVRHYLHELRGCYQRELSKLQRGQRLEGKVVVKWDIIAKGEAINVEIDKANSTLKNQEVETCIRERLANWIFPEPPVGMTAGVTYPFYFRPEK